jgi:hypothetical protein
LKFGGSVEHYRNFYGVVPNYGTFTFDGSITGNADADFLLGLPQEMKCVIVYRQIDAGIRYGEIVALGKRQRLSLIRAAGIAFDGNQIASLPPSQRNVPDLLCLQPGGTFLGRSDDVSGTQGTGPAVLFQWVRR